MFSAMAEKLSDLGFRDQIEEWIDEEKLDINTEDYNRREIGVIVQPTSNKKDDFKRKMHIYQHKKDPKKKIYVMIKSKRDSNPLPTRTVRRTITTTEGDRQVMFLTMNGGNINIYNDGCHHNEEEDADMRRGSGNRGGGEKRERRHHRRRGSGGSQGNRNASGDRQEKRRDRSRDPPRGKGGENDGSENRKKDSGRDSREKKHDRTKFTEDNPESEYLGTEISGSSGRVPTVTKSSLKGDRSRNGSKQGTPSDISSHKTNTPSGISSHKTNTPSDISSHKTNTPSDISSHKTNTPSGISSHKTNTPSGISSHKTNIPSDVAPHKKDIGSNRSMRAPTTKAPPTTAQPRSSVEDGTLIPSSDQLTEENKDRLDEKASQKSYDLVPSQNSMPKTQEYYQESRRRRHLERS